jgi:hypothetical protein
LEIGGQAPGPGARDEEVPSIVEEEAREPRLLHAGELETDSSEKGAVVLDMAGQELGVGSRRGGRECLACALSGESGSIRAESRPGFAALVARGCAEDEAAGIGPAELDAAAKRAQGAAFRQDLKSSLEGQPPALFVPYGFLRPL